MKSLELIMNNNVTQVDHTTFIIRSQTSSDKFYKVTWCRKKWICNCDDYLKHRKTCKHIYAVRYYLLLKNVTSAVRCIYEEPCCPKCGSSKFVIRRGYRYNKSGPAQRYYCKKCMVKFTNKTAFKGMKNRVEAIISALDLYFRGVSLRQLAEHLELTYGIKVSHGTIHNWIKRYVQLVNGYINRLKANSSDRWHMDDTLIKVSGRHMVVWALLDSETRFLLALHVSGKRGAEEAQRLIKEGLKATKNEPLELISDGLPSYRVAIRKEFNKRSGRGVVHIQGPLTLGFNNKIERFHGILKNRVKTMCCLHGEESAKTFAKGFEIYYNFIKGHKALNGKTPAQVAGLIGHRVSWLDLILNAGKYNV
jgi:transposase-like protein